MRIERSIEGLRHRVGAAAMLLCCAALVAVALAVSSAFRQSDGEATRRHGAAGDATSIAPASDPRTTPRDVDPAASASWSSRVFADLGAREYHASPDGDGWQAPNRAQNLRIRFQAERVTVEPRVESRAAWVWEWRTTRWGREDALYAVAESRPSASGARVSYERGAMVEWYENRPPGIEQGFTIESPPEGSGDLVIEGRIGDELSPVWNRRAESFEYRDRRGAAVLEYGGLAAFDRDGRSLPARWSLTGSLLAIHVDDREALYPVTVDPIIASAAWSVVGDQDSAAVGTVVATAGDVNGDGFSDVLVGAPRYDQGFADAGKVFLYMGGAAGLSTSPAWTRSGGQIRARFGAAVGAAGDVNGDGYADVLVGAPDMDSGETDEGLAYLFLGSASGLAASPAWTAEGNQAGAGFGGAVAAAGDVNGDLLSDVIIGASRSDSTQADEGRAYVYLGTASGLSPTPQWTGRSGQAGARYGASVCTAGDVDRDGYADVIVGAPYYDDGQIDEGAAFVHLGGPAGVSAGVARVLQCDQDSARFGWSVSIAGDVSGDGYCDVIVGAPGYSSNRGRAFLYHGSAAGTQSVAAWVTFTGGLGDEYGHSVATAGDVNGDGYADVIVGAPRSDGTYADAGLARVYQGSAGGLSTAYEWQEYGYNRVPDAALFGSSVAAAGDVNGDGYGDVIVGAPGVEGCGPDDCSPLIHDAGEAVLFLGAPSGPGQRPGWTAESNQTGAQLGLSAAGARDVNGDGYSDVIVGAPYWDGGFSNQGAAFVYLGSDTGLALNFWNSVTVPQLEGRFGWSVAGVGDLNGDGFGDVIVGAPYFDGAFADQGAAFLYFGSASGLNASGALDSLGYPQAGALVGWSVAGAGDVNGDGFNDAIVGARGYDGVGRVFVLHGRPGFGSGDPAAGFSIVATALAQFGWSVGSAGDVNGDGFGDVIVGAPFHDGAASNAGRAYVFPGSAAGAVWDTSFWRYDGASPEINLGVSVAGAGDVNGDGYGDVVVGADRYSGDRGAAYVFLGSAGGPGPAPAWTRFGAGAGDRLGSAVAAAGDVNLDGYSDVLVGQWGSAPVHGTCATAAAMAYLGSASGLSTSSAWSVCLDGASQGVSVSSAGDVNGDGFSDILVGTPRLGNGQTNEGGAGLYYGGGGRALTESKGGRGLARAARVVRSDSATAIDPPGRSGSHNSVHVQMRPRGPAGLEDFHFEVILQPAPLTGGVAPGPGPASLRPIDVLGCQTSCPRDTSSTSSSTTNVPSEIRVGHDFNGLKADTRYIAWARLVQHSPFFPHSPWLASPYVAPTAPTFMTSSLTGVSGRPGPGAGLRLEAPRPNPSRGGVTFGYSLDRSGPVRLEVLDVSGRRVDTIVEGLLPAGAHVAVWDGRGAGGHRVEPGVYFARLESGREVRARKFMVVR